MSAVGWLAATFPIVIGVAFFGGYYLGWKDTMQAYEQVLTKGRIK